jgi:hypothetical protein
MKIRLQEGYDSILPGLIIAAGFFLTYVLIFNTNAKEVSRENNAYIRGVACILSINAAGRSQNDIERCWRAVQKETGIPVRRYDKELTN